MIGNNKSSSNGNIGVAMTFNQSTSTINAQWIGNLIKYMILRPINGQYKCVDHNLHKKSIQQRQINQ